MIDDLLKWYDENARVLPWRNQNNAYYTWVSEIMLQQTRVEAVKGYFARFISELPDVKALAEADPDKLMKLWEGLGYYNRVRNMQKAAITVMDEYDGVLPNDYKELLKLSGIGTYTAGAIASIAYNIPVPAVDGNVLRVTKRLTGSYDDITLAKVKKELEEDLLEVMPKDRSGDFNQAIMDLGATVCLPNGAPLCDKCPLSHCCEAYKKGITDELPVKPSKKARKLVDKTVFLFKWNNKYALHKRGDKGLLAGLWEFPNLDEKLSIEKLESVLEENGILEYELELLGEAKHIFSHVEWHMLGYRVLVSSYNNTLFDEIFEELVWVSKDEILEEYAIPTAFSAYSKQL